MRSAARAALLFAVLMAAGTAVAADVDAGKTKSGTCAGCHGANGEGKAPNPPLAGMKADKFAQAMKDYKSGKRANAMMKAIATPLGDQDVDNLAAYYASLKK